MQTTRFQARAMCGLCVGRNRGLLERQRVLTHREILLFFERARQLHGTLR